jgi:hypothetical protein
LWLPKKRRLSLDQNKQNNFTLQFSCSQLKFLSVLIHVVLFWFQEHGDTKAKSIEIVINWQDCKFFVVKVGLTSPLTAVSSFNSALLGISILAHQSINQSHIQNLFLLLSLFLTFHNFSLTFHSLLDFLGIRPDHTFLVTSALGYNPRTLEDNVVRGRSYSIVAIREPQVNITSLTLIASISLVIHFWSLIIQWQILITSLNVFCFTLLAIGYECASCRCTRSRKNGPSLPHRSTPWVHWRICTNFFILPHLCWTNVSMTLNILFLFDDIKSKKRETFLTQYGMHLLPSKFP